MLELLLQKAKKPVPAGIYTKVRLVALTAVSSQVGVHEFQIYDSTNKNLCREPGTVPTVTFSPAANGGTMGSYPPSNTIDGNMSDWTATCYMNAAANGTAFLEYTFPIAINILKWVMKAEGNWLPAPNGMKVMVFSNDVWVDLKATTPIPGWTTHETKEFTVQP